MLTALQLITLALLSRPYDHPWSVQGFGVLRLFIEDVGRLHIWDTRLRYPGVSLIHNHSWNLDSVIVAGELMNTRYVEQPVAALGLAGYIRPTHWKQRLLTGFQSHMVSAPSQVNLLAMPNEIYGPGDTYSQHADEIHETNALDGTITVMRRDENSGDGHADVYWPLGTEWGTAIPRAATRDEITRTIEGALPWLTLATRQR